jgi:NAD-dependent SIR2 family protein deacetylase
VVDGSASLLVLGPSLMVMSGLRFVHRAQQARIPVAIVNRGATRGDQLPDIKVDAALGELTAHAGRRPRIGRARQARCGLGRRSPARQRTTPAARLL